MSNIVHVPIDFTLRSSVRVLARRIQDRGILHGSVGYALLLWLESAHCEKQSRDLAITFKSETALQNFAKDPLVLGIEDYCGWPLDRGSLIFDAVISGFFCIETDEAGKSSISCPEFWEMNQHRLPGFLTIQQRGALKKAENALLNRIRKESQVQQKVMQDQGLLRFPSNSEAQEEAATAIALVMRIDRATGRHVRRSTSEYSADILDRATQIVRNYREPTISQALDEVLDRRLNQNDTADTKAVLDEFHKYVEAFVAFGE